MNNTGSVEALVYLGLCRGGQRAAPSALTVHCDGQHDCCLIVASLMTYCTDECIAPDSRLPLIVLFVIQQDLPRVTRKMMRNAAKGPAKTRCRRRAKRGDPLFS